jgi:hypothetical protein
MRKLSTLKGPATHIGAKDDAAPVEINGGDNHEVDQKNENDNDEDDQNHDDENNDNGDDKEEEKEEFGPALVRAKLNKTSNLNQRLAAKLEQMRREASEREQQMQQQQAELRAKLEASAGEREQQMQQQQDELRAKLEAEKNSLQSMADALKELNDECVGSLQMVSSSFDPNSLDVESTYGRPELDRKKALNSALGEAVLKLHSLNDDLFAALGRLNPSFDDQWKEGSVLERKAALNEHESEMLVHVLGDLRFICRQPAAASSAVLGGLVPMLVELCQRPPGEVPELAMAVLRNCTGPADDCSIAGDDPNQP